MIGKYKVAHLLGVTRTNEAEFREVEHKLTLDGFICFAPVVYDYEVYKQHADLLNDMCTSKMSVADICVVVTPWHIGKETTAKIRMALAQNIPVHIYDRFTKDISPAVITFADNTRIVMEMPEKIVDDRCWNYWEIMKSMKDEEST